MAEPTEDELFDLAQEVMLGDRTLDWDQNRGLIYARASALWNERRQSEKGNEIRNIVRRQFGYKLGCDSGMHMNDGRCNCEGGAWSEENGEWVFRLPSYDEPLYVRKPIK